jgi:hypothetical protein
MTECLVLDEARLAVVGCDYHFEVVIDGERERR